MSNKFLSLDKVQKRLNEVCEAAINFHSSYPTTPDQFEEDKGRVEDFRGAVKMYLNRYAAIEKVVEW